MSTGKIVAIFAGVLALGAAGFLGWHFLHTPAAVSTAGGATTGGLQTVPNSTLQNQVPLGSQIASTVQTVAGAADSISSLVSNLSTMFKS